MAMHWKHKEHRTDRSTEHVSGIYRIIKGVPIDGVGRGYCPRCDSDERNQYERGIIIQVYLGGQFGNLHAYFHCFECKLDYYYNQEEVAL